MKRVRDTGPAQPRVSPLAIASALGGEIVARGRRALLRLSTRHEEKPAPRAKASPVDSPDALREALRVVSPDDPRAIRVIGRGLLATYDLLWKTHASVERLAFLVGVLAMEMVDLRAEVASIPREPPTPNEVMDAAVAAMEKKKEK